MIIDLVKIKNKTWMIFVIPFFLSELLFAVVILYGLGTSRGLGPDFFGWSIEMLILWGVPTFFYHRKRKKTNVKDGIADYVIIWIIVAGIMFRRAFF